MRWRPTAEAVGSANLTRYLAMLAVTSMIGQAVALGAVSAPDALAWFAALPIRERAGGVPS